MNGILDITFGSRMSLSDISDSLTLHPTNLSTTIRFSIWSCHYSPKQFNLHHDQLVLAYNTTPTILDIENNIVVMKRSLENPLVTQVLELQAQGALGVILVDNGSCNAYDQKCFPGADKSRDEGFAAQDDHSLWYVYMLFC
jgi:hypothetical protein